MAEIEMIYRKGYCEQDPEGMRDLPYNEQCHTVTGEDMGCKLFYDGTTKGRIGCGACNYAKYKHIYKGASVKNYELEIIEDVYSPWLNCMLVTIGKKEYECIRVSLNGKVIYREEE